MRTLLDAAPAPIALRYSAGQGRPLVLVHERGSYSALADEIAASLSRSAEVSLLEIEAVSQRSQDMLAEQLREWLNGQGAKQHSLIGLGPAGLVLGRVAAQTPRLVRALVLIDSAGRPRPGALNRIFEFFRSKFPTVRPLGLGDAGGSLRPFLHRIRCPALIIVTARSGRSLRRECSEMAASMPSGRYVEEARGSKGGLLQFIEQFQNVPARCPQKNL